MNTLWLLISNFFKLTFNKKIKYLFYFLLPVATVVIFFFLIPFTPNSGISIGYVNKDKGTLGNDLIAYLKRTQQNNLVAMEQKEINKNIIDGNILIALVIPQDFQAKLLDGEITQIELISLQGETVAGFIQGDINQFINGISKLVKISMDTPEYFWSMYSDFKQSEYAMNIIEIADTTLNKQGVELIIGFLLFFIMAQAMIITGLMLKEKQERTYYRIVIAPVKEIVYTLANILAAFIILAAQIIISVFIIAFIPLINLSVPLLYLLSVLLCFGLTCIAIGIFLTSVCASTIQFSLVSNLIVIFSCILGGSFFPIGFMPEFMQKLAVIFPQSWALETVKKIQDGASVFTTGISLLVMLGLGILFIILYVFRIKYNKKVGSFI